MKKVLLTCALLGAMTSLTAADQKKDKCACPPERPMRTAIPLYETFDDMGSNFGVRADLLYMIYNSPSLHYASTETTSSAATPVNPTGLPFQYINVQRVPGELSLGCDLALLYTLPSQPGYSFEFGWYHIVAKMEDTKLNEAAGPDHTLAATGAASSADEHVNAHLAINFFDLMMKKDFAFGDWFSFSPAAGLVGGYMDGKSRSGVVANVGNFGVPAGSEGNTASTSYAARYTTKFEGVGLKLGACTGYKIGWGFKLKADLSYSVLYGLAKLRLVSTQNGTFAATNGVAQKYIQHEARSVFDSLLGLSWGSTYNKDEFYFELHAGWRFQALLNGWKEFDAAYSSDVRELSISGQGLEIGTTLKF